MCIVIRFQVDSLTASAQRLTSTVAKRWISLLSRRASRLKDGHCRPTGCSFGRFAVKAIATANSELTDTFVAACDSARGCSARRT